MSGGSIHRLTGQIAEVVLYFMKDKNEAAPRFYTCINIVKLLHIVNSPGDGEAELCRKPRSMAK
jgi:hypothetical protein